MRTDTIQISGSGKGFEAALDETKKAAAFRGLERKPSLRLQLLTEEMLCMLHSVTGEAKASFWIESEGRRFEMHLTCMTGMDKEKREALIASTTAKKNAAANSFLSRLRDVFEEAMASTVERTYFELPTDIQADLTGRSFDDPEWDRYEQSVLLRLADDVSIAIRGKEIHMTVTKTFA